MTGFRPALSLRGAKRRAPRTPHPSFTEKQSENTDSVQAADAVPCDKSPGSVLYHWQEKFALCAGSIRYILSVFSRMRPESCKTNGKRMILSASAHAYVSSFNVSSAIMLSFIKNHRTSWNLLRSAAAHRFLFPVFFFHFFCMCMKQLQCPCLDAGEIRLIRIGKLEFEPRRSYRMTVICSAFIRFR